MQKKIDLIILAGGKGSRIKKYLKGCPKPIIKINGNRFLDLQIKYFSKFINGKIYILAGYKAQKIKKLYKGKIYNFCKVEVIAEKKILGTGGAIYNLRKRIENDFILMNGDTFFPINLKKFFESSDSKKIIHVALTNRKNYRSNSQLINLKFNKKNELHVSENKTKYMNGGIYFVRRKIFSYMNKKVFSLEEFLTKDLIDKGLVSANFFKEPFIDIGTPNKLNQASKFLKQFYYKPAVIFDRDNTLIYDNGYTHKAKDLVFKPKILNYLKVLSDKNIFLFIVTNQAGIGKGIFTLKDFNNFQYNMKQRLLNKNIFIDDVKFCPFHPKAKINKYKKKSNFRKPGNLMIEELYKEWRFNRIASLVIGDSIADQKMALKSKINFLFAKDIKF